MCRNWRRYLIAGWLAFATLASRAEDGVSDNSILLGQTIGMTGIIAGPVKEMNEGAQAYFNMINREGGVHGRKILLRTLDDKFDPVLAATNAETLIKRDRVFALFQSRGTPHTEAILPILASNKVPLIAPSTGAAIFRKPVNPWVFNVRAKYQDEVTKGVEHFTTLGLNNIGLLHVDDSFGHDGLEGFNNAMKARKLLPAIIAKFPREAPNYDTTAEEILSANPNALIIVSSAKNTVEIIMAIRKRSSTIQIMTLSNNSSQAFVKGLGPEGVGVIVTQIMPAPHTLSTPLGQEFRNAAKLTNVTMSYAAMEGFVSAKVLVEGLRRAGRKLTREGFIHAMESMQRTDFGGLMVSFDPHRHSGSEFVELTMIGKNGKFLR